MNGDDNLERSVSIRCLDEEKHETATRDTQQEILDFRKPILRDFSNVLEK